MQEPPPEEQAQQGADLQSMVVDILLSLTPCMVRALARHVTKQRSNIMARLRACKGQALPGIVSLVNCTHNSVL